MTKPTKPNFMKSFIRILAFVFLFFSLFVFNACQDDEDAADAAPPANIITSTTGVNVSLTYLTGSTAAQALIDADLDLRVYTKNEITVDELPLNWSENEDAFESLTLENTLADGDYYLKVLMYENFEGNAITFTVTVSGGGKEMKANGNYAATKMASNGNYAGPDTSLTVRTVMKVTKSGNNYTITNL